MANESANLCFDKSGTKADDVPQFHANRIFNEMLQRRLHSRCAASANTCPRLTPPAMGQATPVPSRAPRFMSRPGPSLLRFHQKVDGRNVRSSCTYSRRGEQEQTHDEADER